MNVTRVASIFVVCFVFQTSSCKIFEWNPLLNKRHVAALILARGGSKGIPLKNLAKVKDASLLARSLVAARNSEGFDSIWVSTDHDLIAKEADAYGVNVHWRSPETALDETESLFAVQEFVSQHLEVDTVALIQCTSPFQQESYLRRAIQFANGGEPCVFSVTRLVYPVATKRLIRVDLLSYAGLNCRIVCTHH